MKQKYYYSLKKYLIPGLLLLFFGLFKSINILNFPLFWDESVFLNISSNFINNPYLLLNSFNLFPYPIMVWILSFVLLINKVFIINPLLIGRILTVVCDLIASIYLYKIGKVLFNRTAGLISLFIYLSLPLTYLHSRLLLLESMTNMFVLILVHNVILFSKQYDNRYKRVIFLFVIFFGLFITYLTKPTALTIIPVFLLIPWLHNKNRIPVFLITGLLILSAGIIIYLISKQVISYYPGFILNGNYYYAYVVSNFKSNLWKSFWWSNAYLTQPVIFVLLTGILWGLIKKSLRIKWLSTWTASVLILTSFFSTYYFPRHIHLIASPVALICAWLISSIANNKYKIVYLLTALISIVPIYKDLKIFVNPEKADLALEDNLQYFKSWTSGVGLDQIAQKIKILSADSQTHIFTQDDIIVYWSLPNLYGLKNLIFHNELSSFEIYSSVCNSSICFMILNKNPVLDADLPFYISYSYTNPERSTINIYKYSGVALPK